MLDVTRNHAVGVHLNDMTKVHATFERFPSHVSQHVVGEHIAADMRGISLDEGLVTLGGVEDNLCSVLLSVIVESRKSGPVRDNKRHLHLEETDAASLIVRQLDSRQLLVDSRGNDSRISNKWSPVFKREALAVPLD